MRLICVPNLAIFIFTLFTFSHIISAEQQQVKSIVEKSNTDDTSLFRDVENIMDEEGDDKDDADRILKSLQDTFSDDEEEEDESEQVNHISSKDIKQRIQPDDADEEEEEDQEEEDQEEDQEEEDQEEDEEEDYDFPADAFPDFKNGETSEFFDHFRHQENQEEEKNMPDDETDIIEEEEEGDDEEVITIENPTTQDDVPLPIDNTITWHKSDPLEKAVIDDDKFYQENNTNQISGTEIQLWHGMSLFLVLAIIYKWVNKSKSNHVLDNSNSSLSWHNRDEKDYLPLHNNSSRHFKWEIKTS
ncbi:hypothetical protein BD770DRAFT_439655 [Pilaira anomala]|nr:hypothetical protein BD770DRAFT_439655 [Pilaira anomala]